MGISIRAYSRRRGVSDSAVHKAIQSGRVALEPDGTIDPVKADAAWEQNTDPSQQRKPQPTPTPTPTPTPVKTAEIRTSTPDADAGSGIPNYQMSRAIREVFNAKMARLEYEEKSKKLLKAVDVEREAFDLARKVRDRILIIPSRISAILASEADVKEIERILTKELRTAIEDISSS